MRLSQFTLPVAVTAFVLWTVVIMGLLLGVNAAYEAGSAAEASIEVSTHIEEVRNKPLGVDRGVLQKQIEGTQLGWLNGVVFSNGRVASWFKTYVAVPSLWFGLTLGDVAAGVFYHHLLWLPVGAVKFAFRVAGMLPMVGLLTLYVRHAYRLWGDLR